MVFTVEVDYLNQEDKNRGISVGEIELFLDEDAIDYLVGRLQAIKKHKSHDHFMTPSWSGNELTEEKMRPSNILVNKLTINYVPTDYKLRPL